MTSGLIALAVALAAFFVGPLLVWSSQDSPRVRAALDGMVLALVGGIGLFYLGPHAVSHGGLLALGGIVVGALVPALLHGRGHTSVWAGGGFALLAGHALVDGAALAVLNGSLSTVVAVGVAAHRLPVGLAVGVAVRPAGRAALVLGVLALLTVAGFVLGSSLGDGLAVGHLADVTEGLVVGGLLHVVVAHPLSGGRPGTASGHDHGHSHGHHASAPTHEPAPSHDHGHSHAHRAPAPTHDHDHGHSHGHHASAPAHEPPPSHGHSHDHAPTPSPAPAHTLAWLAPNQANALGLAFGTLLLLGMAEVLSHDHHHGGPLEATLRAFWSLALTSAPALLLGFTLAGLVSGLLAGGGVGLFAGRSRGGQALRGVLFGLPLPVCSCGVVPMYQSLIQRGAPVTAGLAFLIATPELGLDALLLSVPLLGWPLTVARVVAAFLVAILVAVLVGAGNRVPTPEPPQAPAGPVPDLRTRVTSGLRYGLVELVDHTLPWIVFGLLLAAFLEPLLDHTVLAGLSPVLQVPLAAVVGLPLYVCASGATPLAAVAVHKGLSAGAALTFLLAGPATNVTTFGVLSALHGRRVAIRFGVTLTVLAALVGWGVDLIGVQVPDAGHPGDPHVHGGPWFEVVEVVCLAGLALVAAASLWRQGARGAVGQILHPIHQH